MMRKVKLFSILLVIMFLLLSSCSSKTTDQKVNSATDSNNNSEQIQVAKGLSTVKVTFPAWVFQGSESKQEEIEENAKKQGAKVIFNDDGSVTYEMSKEVHKKLLDDFKKTIDDAISEMLKDPDGNNPFKKITYNDDFSEFNITVDNSKYSPFDSLTAIGFYFYGTFYQCLQGSDNPRVIVNFIDKDTGKVLNTADSSKMGEQN